MSDNSTITEKDLDALQLMAGFATDMVYRLRYDTMRYDYISPSAEKLLGFTPEELMRINFRSLILETRLIREDLRIVTDFNGLENDRKQGKTLKWQADYRIRTKDGKTLWVADVSYPWFDDDGAIIGSIGTLRDITERVQAEEAYLLANIKLHTTDHVTGLMLRNAFFDYLGQELIKQPRQNDEVGVLVIALESLPSLRISHGETDSNIILQHIITIIRATIADTDVLARMDEDVLALCLCETSLQNAFALAERIRENISTHVFRLQDGTLFDCAISVGLSSSRIDEKQSALELYKIAENRLVTTRHGMASLTASSMSNMLLH